MSKEAVFFDRDGTLNRSNFDGNKSHAPTTFADFEIFPEAIYVISRLKELGFQIIVITNQPTIATGVLPLSELEKMNKLLLDTLKVNAIHYCPHTDHVLCNCRKPEPGMLFAARDEHDLDLSKSFMVGDTWKDVIAGQKAGCKTILLRRQWSEEDKCNPDFVIDKLSQALDIISQRSRI